MKINEIINAINQSTGSDMAIFYDDIEKDLDLFTKPLGDITIDELDEKTELFIKSYLKRKFGDNIDEQIMNDLIKDHGASISHLITCNILIGSGIKDAIQEK